MIPGKVFLEIFAGTSPVTSILKAKGYAVVSVDIRGGGHFDLSKTAVFKTLVGWIKAGLVWGVHLATPCTTTTRARREVAGQMPTALRSAERPRGLPDLAERDQARVVKANTLIDRAAQLLRLLEKLGIPACEENPWLSFLWWFRSRVALARRWPTPTVDFCAGGGPVRKRTRLLFINAGQPATSALTCRAKKGICSFTGARHLHIGGKRNGQWISKLHEPYPKVIAKFIAETLEAVVHRIAVARLSAVSRTSIQNNG